MGLRPQCYILRPKVIGPLVPEKKNFEGFLTYMGVAAILVMWPRSPDQTFVPLTHRGSTWNLALIGPAVLEKKIFENDGRTATDNGRTTDDGACLYFNLTNEYKGSGELKRLQRKSTSNFDTWHCETQRLAKYVLSWHKYRQNLVKVPICLIFEKFRAMLQILPSSWAICSGRGGGGGEPVGTWVGKHVRPEIWVKGYFFRSGLSYSIRVSKSAKMWKRVYFSQNIFNKMVPERVFFTVCHSKRCIIFQRRTFQLG